MRGRKPILAADAIERIVAAQVQHRRTSPKALAREYGCSASLVRAVWRRDSKLAWIARVPPL